jgi:hypothetical protein
MCFFITNYNQIKLLLTIMTTLILPKLKDLPLSLPIDGTVRIEVQEGVPIFRASHALQQRIEEMLFKQKDIPLSTEEEAELTHYEELDDYLSFVNRMIRNLYFSSQQAS